MTIAELQNLEKSRMADALSEFGDALFWQTPLPEVALFEVEALGAKDTGSEEKQRGCGEEVVQLENDGGKCHEIEDSGGNKKTSCSINMVLVQFTLSEQAMVVPEEVFDALKEVEKLVREKSATFFASEWLSDEEGKMEVVMRERDEAESLVEQLNNTLWHPLLSLVVTLNVVPSLNKGNVGEKCGLKEEKADPVLSSPSPPSTSTESTPCGEKPKESLREVLGGMLTKKKVSGRTSEEKVRQHMMNYMIEKIQRIDEKIREVKEEQHLVQEEMEVLDSDIVRLEDQLEECRQNCPSRAGVVFPAMDIRYKVVKPGDAQSDLTSEEKLNCEEEEDEETDSNPVIEEEVERVSESQVVPKSDLEETLPVESSSLLEGDLLDGQSTNAISGLRGTLEVLMEEKTNAEKGSESCEEKLVAEEEMEKESEKVAGRRLDVERRSAALVCKAVEMIIDCDSD